MWRADGIDVATEDMAAWDAAVAAFRRSRRDASIKRALSSVGGSAPVDPVTVLGAAECGLDGSRAILTQPRDAGDTAPLRGAALVCFQQPVPARL